jgi:peptidoglycan/LPS O-acetylase OafA/YrhL
LIQQDLVRPVQGLPALELAIAGALFTWLITFGLMGLALGLLDRQQPAFSYLADSSYWVYLCHLPIVGLLQVDLYPIAAPALVKFGIVLTGSLAICFASYQVAVRHTVLGSWLHGRRDRTRPHDRSTSHTVVHAAASSPARQIGRRQVDGHGTRNP